MTTPTHSIAFLALFAVLQADTALAQKVPRQEVSLQERAPEGLFAQAVEQIAVRGHESARIQIRLVGRRVVSASSNRRSGVLIEVRASTLDPDSESRISPAVYVEQGVVTDFPLTFVDSDTVRNATATLKVLSVTSREVMIEYLQRGETYSIH